MSATAIGQQANDLVESGLTPLTLVRPDFPGSLRGVVREAYGYAETSGSPLRRRELPTADVLLILNLGGPLSIALPDEAPFLVPGGSGFVAGLHDVYVVTETAGSQAGIELRLSPPNAYRLLGQPLDAITNRSVALDDILGRPARELMGRLSESPNWTSRFALLEDALGARLTETQDATPEIVWAWRQLVASGGRAAIATLADELGWSHRRLIARFREEVGLPPKQAARLLRFQRASEAVAGVDAADWGSLAPRCGYYDQSHLINEFRAFAGDTPAGLVRRRLAAGGYAAD